MLKQFTIDEAYICDVPVRIEYSLIEDYSNPTDEDLINILKGYHKAVAHTVKDHDEFTKLRNQLAQLGYIQISRNCWNGDKVLKSFKLNEWTLNKGHRFPCAAAMKINIQCAKKFGKKSISNL